MRRSVAVTALCMSTIVLACFVAGCEDGPNQPFSPAPAGAANSWNGPSGGGLNADAGVVGSGTQNFDAGFGGTNANDLCTADQEKAVWNKYFSEPIQIPGLAGGIDMAGGPNGDGASGYQGAGMPFTYDPTKETWTGATVEQAEKVLCQGTADSIFYGETNTLGWGENLEMSVLYNVNSRQITDLLFTYGYQGTADATSADGKTKYSIRPTSCPSRPRRPPARRRSPFTGRTRRSSPRRRTPSTTPSATRTRPRSRPIRIACPRATASSATT